MLKSKLATIGFISWMVFVASLSLFSFSKGTFYVPRFQGIDKVVHFVFYCVAAILGGLALREQRKQRIGFLSASVVIGSFLISFGTIIEILQEYTTLTRKGDVFDMLANTIGVITGILLLKLYFSCRPQLKWKN